MKHAVVMLWLMLFLLLNLTGCTTTVFRTKQATLYRVSIFQTLVLDTGYGVEILPDGTAILSGYKSDVDEKAIKATGGAVGGAVKATGGL